MIRFLSALYILFLQSCLAAPSPNINFEFLLEPVIIIKTEESNLGFYNINTRTLASKDELESAEVGSNRIKRNAEDGVVSNPDGEPEGASNPDVAATTTGIPAEASVDQPNQEKIETSVQAPDPSGIPSSPGGIEVATAANTITDAASKLPISPNQTPAIEAPDLTKSADNIKNAGIEAPDMTKGVDAVQNAGLDAPEMPKVVDPLQKAGIDAPEMPKVVNSLQKTGIEAPEMPKVVDPLQKAGIEVPEMPKNVDPLQKAGIDNPDVAEGVETIQNAASGNPATAQIEEASGGFGMPDLSSLAGMFNNLIQSGQQIANGVKDAVVGILDQISGSVSGMVG